MELTEETLNTSLEFIHYPSVTPFTNQGNISLKQDKINVLRYTENNPENARSRLFELIDANIPVMIGVDLYYINYHNYYQKNHILHYVVVTGYDQAEGCLELFDVYKLTNNNFNGRLKIEEVDQARNSENPQFDPINGRFSRPLLNIWSEVEVGPEFRITEDKILSIITKSCRRMNGSEQVLNQKCGLGALKSFKRDLLLKKEAALDEKNLYLFRTYYTDVFKYIARNRKRFREFLVLAESLHADGATDEVLNLLDNSSQYWNICANLSLKYAISKKNELIDAMVKELKLIRETEEVIVDKLNRLAETCF